MSRRSDWDYFSDPTETSRWARWMFWTLALFAIGGVLANFIYSVVPILSVSVLPLVLAYGIGLAAMLKYRTSWLLARLVSRDSEPVRYWIGICLYLSLGVFFGAVFLVGWLFEG